MKSLKYLFLTGAFILSLIIGCAGGQVRDTSPANHAVDITVHSANDAVITVEQDELVYKKPDSPYLHPSGVLRINRAEDTAFMSIYSGLSVSDVKSLWQDIMYLNEETDIKQVIMFINSPGGGAFAGLALADLIERAETDYGIMFEANASGIIASAAVPPFA
ncbi:MAG: ATP-dependent Clp protease proteolytic subunit, partial [Thiotrichaceae bacterium]